LLALLPPGTRFILVDQGQWGGEQLVEGRSALRFAALDGVYGGPPDDDRSAVREVKRLRRHGASCIVFWRDAFWWLEHYPGLARYLDTAARPALNNDHLMVFDFRLSYGQPESGRVAATHSSVGGD